jgi:hypothetical protein
MRIPALTLLGIFVASFHVAADTSAAPGAGELEALLECQVPFAAARENLEALGYTIQSGAAAGEFVTQYKTSELDSERRLLGSLAVERARQYRVMVSGTGIRFAPRHRETVFAAGVLGRRNDETREYELPLTEATRKTLADMRREVCANAAPEKRRDQDVERYIVDRCKAGDEQACSLLKLR